MYSTCIFCNHSLGHNDVVESFPVGRTLAFDSSKGRLWVVCRHCARWNLSPIEQRWEALEDCERLFAATHVRVSTENIGLARLASGLALVRIGKPLRPEFAAWRYGEQFGRRRIKRLVLAGTGMTGLAAVAAGGLLTGAAMLALSGTAWTLTQRIINGAPDDVVTHLPLDGRRIEISRRQCDALRLIGTPDDPWRLQLRDGNTSLVLTADDARRAAELLLPHMNRFGATRVELATAIQLIDRAGDARGYVGLVSNSLEARRGTPIRRLPYPMRLGLEMAVHEDAERRALEAGELKELERAWQEAEEIAAISDALL